MKLRSVGLVFVLLSGGVSCAGMAGTHADAGTGTGGSGGRDAAGAGGADAAVDNTPVDVPPPVTDFPTDVVLGDPTLPNTVPGLFAQTARPSGAPCLIAPEAGTLMPKNWLRPRFEYAPVADENLFEITLTVARFSHPLKIYTRDKAFALGAELWNWLRVNVVDEAIQVSVRGLTVASDNVTVTTAPSPPAQSSFTIAPVDAPGKIVYWSISNDNGVLKGFGIGEEGVREVLRGEQVQTRDPSKQCVGCHAATPDGENVGFAMGSGGYFNFTADIRQSTLGAKPTYATDTGIAALATLHGIPAYSKAHWSAGDRIAILSDTGAALHWVQIDGDQQGVIARTGDGGKVTEPTFSHDGQTIVYVSTAGGVVDGRSAEGPMDLYSVPYADRAGGTAKPLPGASDPGQNEYYPAFSPDDELISFTRLAGSGDTYNQAAAEVFVIPAAGGAAVRLKANDAPACQSTLQSPGLTNDWPKWSPSVATVGNKTYYWLTFSSRRAGKPQLFITAYVKEVPAGGGAPTWTSTPALYLWNQPADEGNHTPSWEDYQIPPVIVK